MNLQIFAKEIDLTDDLRELVEKKFSKKVSKFLKKYDPDALSTRLTMRRGARWGFRVKFEMDMPGTKPLFAEAKHKELAYAVTELAEEVTRILRREKEKRQG